MKNGTLETIGYAEKDADRRIAAFMTRPGARLVDIRLSPWCRWNEQWSKTALHQTYGNAYIHLRTFGNVNHGKPLPIQLLNPEKHLTATVRALQRGLSLLLLCACKDYERCHRKTVFDLISSALQQAEQQAAIPEPFLLSRMEYDHECKAMRGRLPDGQSISVATETFVDALSFMPASFLDVPEHWLPMVHEKVVWTASCAHQGRKSDG